MPSVMVRPWPVGWMSAKNLQSPGSSVRSMLQVPFPSITGCTCWNPVVSRRTAMKCNFFSCSGVNSVTGLPSGPVTRKVTVRAPAVRIVASSSRV